MKECLEVNADMREIMFWCGIGNLTGHVLPAMERSPHTIHPTVGRIVDLGIEFTRYAL